MRAADAGNAVKREADNPSFRHHPDKFVIGGSGRVKKSNQILTALHHIDFVFFFFLVITRFFYLQNNVGPRGDNFRIVHQHGARFLIRRVGIK